MNPRALVGSVLLLTATTLPAQYFLAVGTEPRRVARASWIGQSGQQHVAIEYGQARWRAEYEDFVKQGPPGPVLLGNGSLATLKNDVELTFGTAKLPRGRWYLGAHRDGEQWSLMMFPADRVDASGRGTTIVLSTEPALRVPVRMSREAAPVELFEMTLASSKKDARGLDLTMAFGPYLLRADFAGAFDERKPEGLPEFARTAEGKGTKTASGLVWEQLKAGAGEKPRPGQYMRMHYTGWLGDGTLFESTYTNGHPELLTAEMIVPGLAEGLQLMQPGATFRLTIPPALAFGDRGMGRVPPNTTIVYTVTLLGSETR